MRLLSTLGWSADVVIYPLKVLKPEEAVVFYGYLDGSADERRRVEEAINRIIEESPVKPNFVKVDPFSIDDCIDKMSPHVSDGSVANITGGTKIMAFVLTLLSVHRRKGEIPLIYVVTEDGDMRMSRIPLVIEKFYPDIKRNTTAYLILRILADRGGVATTKEIKEDMRKKYGKGVTGSTFNQAKNRLIEMNAIVEERNPGGRGYRYRLNPMSRIFLVDQEGDAE